MLIVVDLVNGFIIEGNKKRYLLNFLNIIDFITVIPMFVEYAMET